MEELKVEGKKKRKLKPITIIIIVVLALILGFAGFVIYKRYFAKVKSTSLFNLKKSSVTVVNDLDGTKVDPALAKRHPLAVMIENYPDSRPQTGLNRASIVYEAITEGGITRFMAVYGPYDAPKVGPTRSARTYFIDWAAEFKAFYAHVGGNLDALDKIITDNISDLDQFGLGETAYWREPKAGIAIEHTMYTSTDKLYKYAFETKKWQKEGSFTPLKFVEPTAVEKRDSGQTITVDFSSASYLVSWKYDKEKNVYLRSLAGSPHKDGLSSEQLSGANIIVQSVERWEAPTSINEPGWAMKTVGTGKALIFSQGKQTTGTWSKTDKSSRTIFKDDKGKEISFTPGGFWIEIVPPDVFDKVKVEQQVSPTTTTSGTTK